MGQHFLHQSFSCMYAQVYVKVACAHVTWVGSGMRCMSTWVGGGGRQHGWVEWGWDAYDLRSRGAV